MTTKETYFFHREKKKSQMLLKTLMPCYFRSGWKSRALGTEGQAFGAVSLSWLLFHELQAAQQTQVCFSPPALCTSYLLITRDNPRWKKKGQSSPWPNPASLVMIWKQRGLCVLVFKATWRALFATQNFWNGEFMNTSSNNYMENILFFYKAHAYAIVLGWFPLFFPRTVLCFCW